MKKIKLNEEAIEEIKSFYVKIRNKNVEYTKPAPINIIDLAKIKKSAENFAKKRKSNIATKEDALKAIGLFKLKEVKE